MFCNQSFPHSFTWEQHESSKIFISEKIFIVSGHPSPPPRCNIWGTAPLKAEFLGQNTQSEGYFGFWGLFCEANLEQEIQFQKSPAQMCTWFFKDLMDGWIPCGPRHTRKIEGYPQWESRGCKTCIGVESWYMRKLEQERTEPSSRE